MLALCLLCATIIAQAALLAGADSSWVVRLHGGEQVAELIALETGFDFGGRVANFPDTYIFKSGRISKRDARIKSVRSLSENPKVKWAEQLVTKRVQKRDSISVKPSFNNRRLMEKIRGRAQTFNDELWTHQWYMQDTRTLDTLPKLDLNVLPVYAMGITGKGVGVTILDDGIEHSHEDLAANYDPDISYDWNNNRPDPTPAYYKNHSNAHGTRCAGEVAMVANNGKCGVGVAYGARIGGIKLLDGVVNDILEGNSLGFATDKVDIYSASWGPTDNGELLEGPGRLAQEAFEKGVSEGRGGKGSIYVWASGNGGVYDDNCNCDGYVSSIYTVAIGSVSESGDFPWYAEKCSSLMAVTYSSGAYTDQMITTTDLNNKCTIKHTGTSASAPLAAGIIALALEANPKLTWRDVQHLLVLTCEHESLAHNDGWIINGMGHAFNVRFGFGLMNAHALVLAAIDFKTVPDKAVCHHSFEDRSGIISYARPYVGELFTSACLNTSNEINYLEHVQLEVNIDYPRRGSLEVYLTSPSGTRVSLLVSRWRDKSKRGFFRWQFMSVATWGESPAGTWKIEVLDETGPEENEGTFGPVRFIFHGTKDRPAHMTDKHHEKQKSHPQSQPNEIGGRSWRLDEDTDRNDEYSNEHIPLYNY